MPFDKTNARARARYTLEPYSVALRAARACRPGDALVPDADAAQAAFEAAFITALARQIGPHHPGGAPYGIDYVSPMADAMWITFLTDRVAAAAQAVLPRLDEEGRWHGLPGLRLSFSGSKRYARAEWEGGSLRLAPGAQWAKAARLLAGQGAPPWTGRLTGSAHEQAAAAQLLQAQRESAALLSRTLRRIGLLAEEDVLDVAARPPHPAQLLGQDAGRVGTAPAAPCAGRGACPVIALTSVKGGTGLTTLVAQMAGILALQHGLRVAAATCEDPSQSDLAAALGQPAAPHERGQLWTEVRRSRPAGLLAFARLPQDPDALRAHLAQLKQQFDLILVDASLHSGAPAAAEVSDLFYCVVTLGPLTHTQPADPAMQSLIRAQDVARWLTARWEAHRTHVQDEIWASLDDDDNDDDLDADESPTAAAEYYQAMLRLSIEADDETYARARRDFLAGLHKDGADIWGADWTVSTMEAFTRRDDRRVARWRERHAGPVEDVEADDEWDDEVPEEELDEDERAYRAVKWVDVPRPPEGVADDVARQAFRTAQRSPDGLIANQVGPGTAAETLAAVREVLSARDLPLLAPCVPASPALRRFGRLLQSAPAEDRRAHSALADLAQSLLTAGRAAARR